MGNRLGNGGAEFEKLLTETRKKVDALDAHLLALLSERERLVVGLFDAKIRVGRSIIDTERESKILDRSRDWPGFYSFPNLGAKVYRAIMDWSRMIGLKRERAARRLALSQSRKRRS